MKKLFLLLAAGWACQGMAQAGRQPKDASAVLQKVAAALNQLQQVSYHFTRETRYYGDNYHDSADALMYIAYTPDSPIGLRFQASHGDALFVYNNSLVMEINRKDSTIDSTGARTAAQLQHNSFLYHSLAMLRNILPGVLREDSIQKSITDTVVNGRLLYAIRLEMKHRYFGLFAGTERYSVPGLQRPYYLLVDRASYLPYRFVAKYIRNGDDRDFVAMTYTRIDTTPPLPAAESWSYAAYRANFHPLKKAVPVPLVKTGTLLADFRLPVYTAGGVDTLSLHQYAGKAVLVEFWFKSCGYCMTAMPSFNSLQSRFSQTNFQLLTVNIEDGPDDMQFFFNKYNPAYPMLFNGGRLFESLGLRGCPSAVLLDANGKIAAVWMGFNRQEVEAKVSELLRKG